MEAKTFGLFNSWDLWDEEIRNEIKNDLAECNGMEPDEVSDEWIDDTIMGYLDDERANLNVETGGCIIAMANLGLWNGHHTGYKIIGGNVRDIFNSFMGGDHCNWFADKYNVRAEASHHDGTNCIVFRVAKDRETAERIGAMIYYGEIKDEDEFFRRTKSLRPYIAEVYGWKQYGKQAAKKEAENAWSVTPSGRVIVTPEKVMATV